MENTWLGTRSKFFSSTCHPCCEIWYWLSSCASMPCLSLGAGGPRLSEHAGMTYLSKRAGWPGVNCQALLRLPVQMAFILIWHCLWHSSFDWNWGQSMLCLATSLSFSVRYDLVIAPVTKSITLWKCSPDALKQLVSGVNSIRVSFPCSPPETAIDFPELMSSPSIQDGDKCKCASISLKYE